MPDDWHEQERLSLLQMYDEQEQCQPQRWLQQIQSQGHKRARRRQAKPKPWWRQAQRALNIDLSHVNKLAHYYFCITLITMNITLVKTTSQPALGHFYEHLICMEIKKSLYDQGFFKRVDYSLTGTTYDIGGLIEIDIHIYGKDIPRTVVNSLRTITCDIDELKFTTALQQIYAEEGNLLHVGDYEDIVQAITDLDAEPWQDIRNISTIDATTSQINDENMYYVDADPLKPQKIITTITLDKVFTSKNRKLLPLFYQLAKVSLFTTQDVLCNNHGYYVEEFTHKNNKSKAIIYKNYSDARIISAESLSNQQIKAIQYIQSSQGFERMLTWLQSVSYETSYWEAPNPEEIYNETGIYTGEAGWSKIAIQDNVDLLLQNITITVQGDDLQTFEKSLI